MSDTPRTDAHNWNEGHYDDPLHSLLDFAKQLERELNAANDRIKRLEEAGDALLELCEADESKFHLADHIDARCDAWRKSKEAKL